jgi:hypothetical protein
VASGLFTVRVRPREADWALGIMFRPAGFRPFPGRPASAITDRVAR